jgi:uridine phosphorylase
MPSRLRPTAPVAADAILVGDPGRALMLAQELLESPRMSNHARGLWGYSGRTPTGAELTIQATGIGGPSAAAVLADLAELGVRRAIRVGTCAGLGEELRGGEILLASEAVAAGGSVAAFGVEVGAAVEPDRALLDGLRGELEGEAREARVGSYDAMPVEVVTEPGIEAADMQTAALLARASQLGLAAAAVLIVTGVSGEKARISDEALEAAAKRAGRAASLALSA